MRLFLTIFFLFISTSVFAGELWVRAIDSTPFDCNGDLHDVQWINEGPPIKVKIAQIWIGADKGTIADISASMYRISNWMGFHSFGWDRYGQPNGPHQVIVSFGQDWITIGTGDGIALQTWCVGFNGQTRHAHAVGTFWYTQD